MHPLVNAVPRSISWVAENNGAAKTNVPNRSCERLKRLSQRGLPPVAQASDRPRARRRLVLQPHEDFIPTSLLPVAERALNGDPILLVVLPLPESLAMSSAGVRQT